MPPPSRARCRTGWTRGGGCGLRGDGIGAPPGASARVGGEVVGDDVGVPAAEAEVGGDLELAAGHVLGHRLLVVGHGHPAAGHRHAAVGDGDPVGVELDPGAAEVARHPAPVRVAPVPRALGQLAVGDRSGATVGVVRGGRALHLDPHDLGGALGVAGHLHRERPAHVRDGHQEVVGRRRRAGLAVGQDDDGVVGGRAAVHDQPVEASRPPQPAGTAGAWAGRPRRRSSARPASWPCSGRASPPPWPCRRR